MESDPVSIPRGAVNPRRHVARGLKWLGVGLAALVALGLAGCLSYPLWDGGGLVSTSAELVRIGGGWMDPNFISVETRKAMWTP